MATKKRLSSSVSEPTRTPTVQADVVVPVLQGVAIAAPAGIGAALFWKMGKKINPRDKNLKRGFNQLDEVARKIYREGYSLQEINVTEAIEKWNEVLMIVPPSHPYYRKAKKRLDRYAESP